MFIRHCVAGVVLVIVGCLAVNAYADPPRGETTAAEAKGSGKDANMEALEARVKQLEERLAADQSASQVAKAQQSALQEQLTGRERALKISTDMIKSMEARLEAKAPANAADELAAEFQKADLERERALRQKLQDRLVLLRQDATIATEPPPQPREQDAPFTTAVWRFQFYPRQPDQPPSERGMMVDTATGRCWVLSLRQPRWEDLGGPYEAVAGQPAAGTNPADTVPPPPTYKKRAPALRLKAR